MKLVSNEYITQTKRYDKVDRLLSIIMAIYFCILLYIYGFGYLGKHDVYAVISKIPTFILTVIPIGIILYIRKQSLTSIGFNKTNLSKSLVLGLVIGGVILTLTFVIGFLQGKTFNTSQNLLRGIPHYLIEIGLTEEILFRGFIQTRLFTLSNKKLVSILFVALLFMLMHIPFQMLIRGMGFFEFISYRWITLLFQFTWHFIFTFLYTKYNNIAAPAVIHFATNYSGIIFVG
ncbi:CPBP family intramembrane glutamic endopeptidase [Mycoplasmatota bacterium WC44]